MSCNEGGVDVVKDPQRLGVQTKKTRQILRHVGAWTELSDGDETMSGRCGVYTAAAKGMRSRKRL